MPSEHRVELVWRDGRRETVAVADGQTVLDGAAAADVALPFGCRTGACATCVGLLREGRVRHVRPPRALKERYLDRDYVLTCVATPETDCAVEVGAAVGTDLASNPWR